MKIVLRVILCLVLFLVVAVAALFVWLTASEFKPEAVEDITIAQAGEVEYLKAGQDLDILSWNIGYAGLGAGSDFFMDGGKDSVSADKETSKAYLDAISDTLVRLSPDIAMLQEVDTNSARSYGVDQEQRLRLSQSAFALNYSCPFVPIPLPPMGRVNSGLMTTTDGVELESAQRLALPCPFSWPVSIANLKRCLLVSYTPIAEEDGSVTGKYLVLVNLHLEAYDNGEGKIAQTKQLVDFIVSEYEKGNYVIAGGDFNQAFPGSMDVYPVTHPELWSPGTLELQGLSGDWTLACDLSVPTCRLLNQPYNPEDTDGTQHFVIDGFILSPNVKLGSVRTVDEGFENSDHNPVAVSVTLN